MSVHEKRRFGRLLSDDRDGENTGNPSEEATDFEATGLHLRLFDGFSPCSDRLDVLRVFVAVPE